MTTALALRNAQSSVAALSAATVLLKGEAEGHPFRGNQWVDGLNGGGRWTDDPKLSAPHPYGPGKGEVIAIQALGFAQQDLETMSMQNGPNSYEAQAAAKEVTRLGLEVERIRGIRREKFEEMHPPQRPVGATYAIGASNPDALARWKEKRAALDAETAAARLESTANNINMHPTTDTLDPVRAKIATVSMRAAGATRNLAEVLTALSGLSQSVTESNKPSTLSSMAAIAGATVALAGAVNAASRARNAPTMINAMTMANNAAKTLRVEAPRLSTAVRASSPRVAAALTSSQVALRQLNTSIEQAKASATQTALRTGFRVTGGKIVSASPAPKPVLVTNSPARSTYTRFIDYGPYGKRRRA